MRFTTAAAMTLLACVTSVRAHDTWVQPNTNLVRLGDVVHLDLMLGNHGADHRDFKLASKVDLGSCTLAVIEPGGNVRDLKDRLVDLGYASNEGFWSARFIAAKPGLYLVSHTLEKIVNHGRPIRAVKSGKTCFAVSPSLDTLSGDFSGFDRVLGHPLEIVLETNPVASMEAGTPIAVRVLFKDRPLAGARVSFIPRGTQVAKGFDERYERRTDAEGRATFTPSKGAYYLIATRREAPDETGPGYEATQYAATLTLYVPQKGPRLDK